jgi:hypothetical protein
MCGAGEEMLKAVDVGGEIETGIGESASVGAEAAGEGFVAE